MSNRNCFKCMSPVFECEKACFIGWSQDGNTSFWQHQSCNDEISNDSSFRIPTSTDMEDSESFEDTPDEVRIENMELSESEMSDADEATTTPLTSSPNKLSNLNREIAASNLSLSPILNSLTVSVLSRDKDTLVPDTSLDPLDIGETSIDDPEPRQVSEDQGPVTFKIIEGGTNKGRPKLVDSRGYTYNFWRQRGKTKNWQCTIRPKVNKCPATVNEKDDTFYLGLKEHNHGPNVDSAANAVIIREVKKRAMDNVFKPATAIVHEVLLEELSTEPCPSLPKVENLARAANKARQRQRPKDPMNMDFSLEEQHLPPDFFQGEVQVRDNRHLLFSTANQLQVLSKAKSWYIDGTFKLCRHPFSQLFSISAFVKHDDHVKQVPLMFVLMSRRKKSDYKKVLQKVKELIPNAVVQHLTADFEKAAWRAVRTVYPCVKITGCVFHWTQALWRKVQALGLQMAYQHDDGTFKYIRKCMALPFLPADEILPQFVKLQEKAQTQQLIEFTNYIDNTWIKSTIWPPTTWSVYGMAVRTNNDVEGWHNALNRRASGKCQLPLYLLIQLLYQEARLVSMQVRLVSEKKLTRVQRKKYRVLQGKIFREWEQYRTSQKTAAQLLKACSRMNGPIIRQA